MNPQMNQRMPPPGTQQQAPQNQAPQQQNMPPGQQPPPRARDNNPQMPNPAPPAGQNFNINTNTFIDD